MSFIEIIRKMKGKNYPEVFDPDSGELSTYPFDVMAKYDVDEIIKRKGYTWFQYAVKKEYYWEKQ